MYFTFTMSSMRSTAACLPTSSGSTGGCGDPAPCPAPSSGCGVPTPCPTSLEMRLREESSAARTTPVVLSDASVTPYPGDLCGQVHAMLSNCDRVTEKGPFYIKKSPPIFAGFCNCNFCWTCRSKFDINPTCTH